MVVAARIAPTLSRQSVRTGKEPAFEKRSCRDCNVDHRKTAACHVINELHNIRRIGV